jgi:hypothetical protein
MSLRKSSAPRASRAVALNQCPPSLWIIIGELQCAVKSRDQDSSANGCWADDKIFRSRLIATRFERVWQFAATANEDAIIKSTLHRRRRFYLGACAVFCGLSPAHAHVTTHP